MSADHTTTPPEGRTHLFTANGVHYALVRELGRAGAGERVLAQRQTPGGPGGLAVIKCLPKTARIAERRRMLEEAQVARRLDHPSIARVLHVETRSSRPLVVMEYVDGLALEQVLRRAVRRQRPVSERFAAYVIARAADALHHAHTLKDGHGRPFHLVHRAVSPSTLRVSKHGEVKLTDFGAVFTCLPGRQRTPAHTLKGAVDYSAPEVLSLKTPEARSDLFSLGVVLVELLTHIHVLDLPHERSSPRLTGGFQRLVGKLWPERDTWADPAWLAERASMLRQEEVAQVLATVSSPLRDVALRALCVEPAGRHATAADMRDALRAYLASSGRPYGPREAVAEVREVISTASQVPGDMETSPESIPHEFRSGRPVRH
ncbi:serine/threonine-protein kinase [Stigmatella aurantiaca]|uniref:Protein kinase domain, putative n=1 Tax=Stigmatella aurantiaca (strain DW4/3-1) TaxID=378806 RepID=Q097M0_STIAD|nr:serine/threonine-protein kinase [Stigmatella aurantiaca]ADO75757.1 serine/threonine protein kinase [Stigmatella aurantiaca DW4/3-1]EAU67938.1 protein kinase domain, putative [Stigmatella aurantiaca DW4/3-1]